MRRVRARLGCSSDVRALRARNVHRRIEDHVAVLVEVDARRSELVLVGVERLEGSRSLRMARIDLAFEDTEDPNPDLPDAPILRRPRGSSTSTVRYGPSSVVVHRGQDQIAQLPD
jgi:hypothetical protein